MKTKNSHIPYFTVLCLFLKLFYFFAFMLFNTKEFLGYSVLFAIAVIIFAELCLLTIAKLMEISSCSNTQDLKVAQSLFYSNTLFLVYYPVRWLIRKIFN